MTAGEMERIKSLIAKAELEAAKSQGAIDNIKAAWREKYGTDDIEEIKKIASEKEKELEALKAKRAKLEEKILAAHDWDALEEELR